MHEESFSVVKLVKWLDKSMNEYLVVAHQISETASTWSNSIIDGYLRTGNKDIERILQES